MDIRAKIFLIVGLIGLSVGGYIFVLMMYLDPASTDMLVDSAETGSLSPDDQAALLNTTTSGSVVSTGTKIVETGAITLAIPGWMMTTGLTQMIDQIARDQHLIVTITGSSQIDVYRTIIQQGYLKSDTIGLALIATDWQESLRGQIQYFQFPEVLSPYFHPLWQPLVDDTTQTMIPFALDPAVMIGRQEISFRSSQPLVSDLIDLWMVSPQLRNNALIVLRGVTSRDRELQAQGRTLDPQWLQITQMIIGDLMATGSGNLIKQLIDLPVLQLIGGRSPSQIAKVSKTLTKQQLMCQQEPVLCLMRYGYGGIFLGRLSDIDRQEILFSGAGQSLSSMQMRGRPSSKQPVRGRGWVVRHDGSQRAFATRMLNGLIGAMVSGTGDLWGSTLPAPNQWYQQARTNPQWSRVINRESQRVMMSGSRDDASRRAREGEWDKVWKGEKKL